MDNFKQIIKTKVQDISSKDLSIDFAEPKVILVQSIIRQMIRKVVDIIDKELSSTEPERETGKWIIYTISPWDGEGCKCSECGFEGVPYWDFCPNCGADMSRYER